MKFFDVARTLIAIIIIYLQDFYVFLGTRPQKNPSILLL
jgi:hypothetical protein